MSNEERWVINDVQGVLMHFSRLFFLAPVRFVKNGTHTFIYISRTVLYFSVIMASTMEAYTIYILCLQASTAPRGYYNEVLIGTFNVSVMGLFVSYAALNGETRIKNYMTCLTKLKRATRVLQSRQEMNIKIWHVLIMFVILAGALISNVIYGYYVYNGEMKPMTYILMMKFSIIVVVQQQFLYFSLYVNFVLKIIKEQLQEELCKIKNEKDEKQLGNLTTARLNIPLNSINKAIDMIGMTDQMFPIQEVSTTRKVNIDQRIRQINDCYVSVCEVIQELSSSDGFLLFVLLVYYAFAIVYCLYNIIRILNEGGSTLLTKKIFQCLEILVLALRVIIIVEPCHVAHKTMFKIRFIICKMMCNVTSSSEPVFKVIDGFYHQMILNDTSYTTLGICKIGRSLVTSILGVVSTVLITIFEF